MPWFKVNYTVHKDHLQGQIEIEADSPQEAVDVVQNTDIDMLLESTSEVEWSVDAWADES